MRNTFEEQLRLLNQELLEMGALIEHAIQSASEALIKQDVESANHAITFDREVDQKERDIESLCLKLLLQQQPVAKDLRLISAALKMITDMERIGDHAQAARAQFNLLSLQDSARERASEAYVLARLERGKGDLDAAGARAG